MALLVLLAAGGVAALRWDDLRRETRFSPAYARVAEWPLLDRVLPRSVLSRRLVTGIAVGGTAAQPVLYVSSSDPRIAGDDHRIPYGDSNSGILSRLTRRADGGWSHEQLVRGLPRSRHDHAPNGLALDEEAGAVYLAVGSMTNLGAPSIPFRLLPEYALSGALLHIDLDGLGTPPYDLPTLDDPTRAGNPDAGDPFGGHDGLNQARIVVGGPVRLHTTGLRNPYDVHRTRAGRLYVTVNGANAEVGGRPRVAGGSCTNEPVEGGTDDLDSLLDVTRPGGYGGHPNPTRAGAPTHARQSGRPVPQPDPRQCAGGPVPAADGFVTSFAESTNGVTEYTASTFDGALAGDLLTVSFDGSLRRVDLRQRGAAAQSPLVRRAGVLPLDVTAAGDEEPFPGSIWVADWAARQVVAFVPTSGACEPVAERCFRRTILRDIELDKPTSLAWGPDGRLYVSEQEGLVKALSIERGAGGALVVSATETITAVRDITNHDDDGRPAARLPLVD